VREQPRAEFGQAELAPGQGVEDVEVSAGFVDEDQKIGGHGTYCQGREIVSQGQPKQQPELALATASADARIANPAEMAASRPENST